MHREGGDHRVRHARDVRHGLRRTRAAEGAPGARRRAQGPARADRRRRRHRQGPQACPQVAPRRAAADAAWQRPRGEQPVRRGQGAVRQRGRRVPEGAVLGRGRERLRGARRRRGEARQARRGREGPPADRRRQAGRAARRRQESGRPARRSADQGRARDAHGHAGGRVDHARRGGARHVTLARAARADAGHLHAVVPGRWLPAQGGRDQGRAGLGDRARDRARSGEGDRPAGDAGGSRRGAGR